MKGCRTTTQHETDYCKLLFNFEITVQLRGLPGKPRSVLLQDKLASVKKSRQGAMTVSKQLAAPQLEPVYPTPAQRVLSALDTVHFRPIHQHPWRQQIPSSTPQSVFKCTGKKGKKGVNRITPGTEHAIGLGHLTHTGCLHYLHGRNVLAIS